MTTDDDRRRVAEALREYASFDCECEDEEELSVDCADWGERVLNLLGCGDTEGECYAYLADLIEPALTSSDRGPTSDPTERGIDSIYDWCRERLEGADGAEDFLYCSIMSAIEEYRHPERVTARTARPVDRDALLALADSLDRSLGWCEPDERGCVHVKVGRLREVVLRIREACGEEAS